MNIHIKSQITNITTMTRVFVQSCEMAAMKDDGKISAEERWQIEKIKKAADRFTKELQTIR